MPVKQLLMSGRSLRLTTHCSCCRGVILLPLLFRNQVGNLGIRHVNDLIAKRRGDFF